MQNMRRALERSGLTEEAIQRCMPKLEEACVDERSLRLATKPDLLSIGIALGDCLKICHYITTESRSNGTETTTTTPPPPPPPPPTAPPPALPPILPIGQPVQIQVMHSNKGLAVHEGFGNGVECVQWDLLDKPNHKFIIETVREGVYKIKVLHSGKYLAVHEGMGNDVVCVQWEFLDKPNHLFRFDDAGNGCHYISPCHSGKSLAVNAIMENGTKCIQWDRHDTPNHKFKLLLC
eukprot:TRINITY_DN66938_c2_g5_i2.p1 TRINITY_DN66938_c2_g5~~TRINITY_DN66938_c2_g5_i2.p1  ORF type:complete len:235 (+),score=10.30 TRINITY_DN66938_c2_g5_i2:101-805(+)